MSFQETFSAQKISKLETWDGDLERVKVEGGERIKTSFASTDW